MEGGGEDKEKDEGCDTRVMKRTEGRGDGKENEKEDRQENGKKGEGADGDGVKTGERGEGRRG